MNASSGALPNYASDTKRAPLFFSPLWPNRKVHMSTSAQGGSGPDGWQFVSRISPVNALSESCLHFMFNSREAYQALDVALRDHFVA